MSVDRSTHAYARTCTRAHTHTHTHTHTRARAGSNAKHGRISSMHEKNGICAYPVVNLGNGCVCNIPGGRKRPPRKWRTPAGRWTSANDLGAVRLTRTAGCTPTPAVSPRSTSHPLGMSIDTTGGPPLTRIIPSATSKGARTPPGRKCQVFQLAEGFSLLFHTLLPVNVEGVRCQGDASC